MRRDGYGGMRCACDVCGCMGVCVFVCWFP